MRAYVCQVVYIILTCAYATETYIIKNAANVTVYGFPTEYALVSRDPSTLLSRSEALALCQEAGYSNLASLPTEEANAVVSDFNTNDAHISGIRISPTDPNSRERPYLFEWRGGRNNGMEVPQNNSSGHYSNWGEDQPDGGGGRGCRNEGAVQTAMAFYYGGWDDTFEMKCTIMDAICERSPCVTSSTGVYDCYGPGTGGVNEYFPCRCDCSKHHTGPKCDNCSKAQDNPRVCHGAASSVSGTYPNCVCGPCRAGHVGRDCRSPTSTVSLTMTSTISPTHFPTSTSSLSESSNLSTTNSPTGTVTQVVTSSSLMLECRGL